MQNATIMVIFVILIIIIIILIYRLMYQINLDTDIHANLFSNLPPSGEIPERIVAYNNLDPEDNVLELGANKGGVSLVIARKLMNPAKQFVSVEPTEALIEVHDKLREKYNVSYNLFTGVVVTKDVTLNCYSGEGGNKYSTCHTVADRTKTTTLNKTVEELEEFYDIKFTALVIDCEGCYIPLFKEWIKTGWINQIRLITIEWDGKFATISYRPYMEAELLKAGFVMVDQRNHKLLWHGVRAYINKDFL
jgi:FkbM family methyltransferase